MYAIGGWDVAIKTGRKLTFVEKGTMTLDEITKYIEAEGKFMMTKQVKSVVGTFEERALDVMACFTVKPFTFWSSASWLFNGAPNVDNVAYTVRVDLTGERAKRYSSSISNPMLIVVAS